MPRYSHDDPQYRAALREMSIRLTNMLNERNWNRADLTRAAAKFMLDGGRFGADNTSNFVNGKRKPTRPFLIAMCKALGVKEEDILPEYLMERPGQDAPQPSLLTQVPGRPNLYRIYIDREMPLPDALLIVEALGKLEGGENHAS